MILSDKDIKQYINEEKLKITPFHEAFIEPASIDLTLGNHFLLPKTPKNGVQPLSTAIEYNEIHADKFTIPAKSFVLANTVEYIELPDNITGFVEGRSSIGRAGLFIQNAGWVDPGFAGQITLELFNANDFALEINVNQRICQLVLAQTCSPADHAYNGKYQGQKNTTGSKVYMDKDPK